jgi:TetR/AcrR family transcriptional regulator of autoinduction and epiphytic fitness
MTQPAKAKRAYTSTRRRLQAGQTRRLILEAARKLFYERGYASATIEAIAQEAGVAAETIYATFGSKLAILHSLVDITLVGDEQPVALLERPFIKAAEVETDQRHLIGQFAQNMYRIMTRMSPIFALLQTTAKADAEIAVLRARLLKERLGGMAYFIDQLSRIGPLRPQAEPDQAQASAWVLSSAEVFGLLAGDLGWSEEQYVTWLSTSLERLLLP